MVRSTERLENSFRSRTGTLRMRGKKDCYSPDHLFCLFCRVSIQPFFKLSTNPLFISDSEPVLTLLATLTKSSCSWNIVDTVAVTRKLQLQEYKNVCAWSARIGARPAVFLSQDQTIFLMVAFCQEESFLIKSLAKSLKNKFEQKNLSFLGGSVV